MSLALPKLAELLGFRIAELRSVSVPLVGAGANMPHALVDLDAILIQSVQAQLVTSAVVASRLVELVVQNQMARNWIWFAGQGIPASRTIPIAFGLGLTTFSDAATLAVNGCLPLHVIEAPTAITLDAVNLQVADQFSAGIFSYLALRR